MSYAPAPTTGTAPLNQPLYGASIGQAVGRFWKKYATFSGRASRSEFWWWALVNIIISGILYGVLLATTDMQAMAQTGTPQFGPAYVVYLLWSLATLIPGLALTWRRLHDTNRSGLWIFISLIPLVGAIILIVFYVSEGNPAGQRFDR
jgi:uncharacterized membrane protein YhaH (DUF805 family)